MSKAAENDQAPTQAEGIPVRVIWQGAEDLPTIYANHLYISHAGQNEFYLVFGELGPQVGLDMDNPPESIQIKPVAKIAVSSPNMIRVAHLIQENVDKYAGKSVEPNEGAEE